MGKAGDALCSHGREGGRSRAQLRRHAPTVLLAAISITAAAAVVAGAQAPPQTARSQPPIRDSVGPTSREAAAWVAEQPQYLPYRLALARALVREGQPQSSLRHYAAVVARQPTPALLAEAADAHAAAGDPVGAAHLYRRAVERAPSDASLRRAYARTLVDRARLVLRVDDDATAERDLLASVALAPTAEAYIVLGDVYRERGQFRRARAAYDQALAFGRAGTDLSLRLAQLRREERPDFGYASLIDEEAGATVGAETLADNAGFAYVGGEARAGFVLAPGTVLGFAVEPRVVYERWPAALPSHTDSLGSDSLARRIEGVGATAGVVHAFERGDVDGRVAGRWGAVAHSTGGSMPLYGVSAAATYRASWSLTLEGGGGPAYTELMALGLIEGQSPLATGDLTETLLSARSLAFGMEAPFGRADLSAQFERMWVSDGNVRSAVRASVRVPLRAGLSVLYSGGTMGFRSRTEAYWDPREDVFHALGAELAARTDAGLAFTITLLPGVGRTAEGLTPGDPADVGETEPRIARLVRQFAAGADLSVRRPPWHGALDAAFATGRSGGYRQFEGGIRVTYSP